MSCNSVNLSEITNSIKVDHDSHFRFIDYAIGHILCLLWYLQCGRITGLNYKNGMDLEQVTWPDMGVHGARNLMQLQQQFWHGDLAHPLQPPSQWEKRTDTNPPVFSNSSSSLFGYDLASSGKTCNQTYISLNLVVCHLLLKFFSLDWTTTFVSFVVPECLEVHR